MSLQLFLCRVRSEKIASIMPVYILCTQSKGFSICNNITNKEKIFLKSLSNIDRAFSSFRLKLGKDWQWSIATRDKEYLDILRLFSDDRRAIYSIHQIALMGESTDGKKVGTWFGPNMVAQVLR